MLMGTVGAIAFAGVSTAKHGNRDSRSTKIVTKTVTKYCVYVDRKDSGDSYGDLSAIPKYGHKTCIAGKPGRNGAKGAAGAQGTTGSTGAQGPQGPAAR